MLCSDLVVRAFVPFTEGRLWSQHERASCWRTRWRTQRSGARCRAYLDRAQLGRDTFEKETDQGMYIASRIRTRANVVRMDVQNIRMAKGWDRVLSGRNHMVKECC